MDWTKEERPLNEWTLAEVKAFCQAKTANKENKYYECYGCDMHGKICQRSPNEWNLGR